MPNQPSPETVTVSFTLPRELANVVGLLAKKKLTNKSDIIRRALLAYIPKDEAEAIMASILNDAPNDYAAPEIAPPKPVTYPKGGRARKPKDNTP